MQFTNAAVLIIATMAASISAAAVGHVEARQGDKTVNIDLPSRTEVIRNIEARQGDNTVQIDFPSPTKVVRDVEARQAENTSNGDVEARQAENTSNGDVEARQAENTSNGDVEARQAKNTSKENLPHATATAAALDPRQSQTVDSTHADQATAETALDDARTEGRRKLSGTTADCKVSQCHTCMSSSVTAAVAEVVGCGIVAAATEVGSSGTATAFVVAGFAACETAITANMAKDVVSCEAYNP